jgi:PAS domain S-box-containing protein
MMSGVHARRESIPAALLAQVHLGSWRWDIEPDEVKWSPELKRMFGYDAGEPPPNWKEHARLYTPESFAELQTTIQHCLETGDPFAICLDGFRRDGTPIHLEGHGAAHVDASGKIRFLYGVTLDRTRERQALLTSQKNLHFYEAMFEQAAVGVVLRDGKTGKIQHLNHRFAAMLGTSPERLIGRSFPDLLHGSYAPWSASPRMKAPVMGRSAPTEMILQHNSGMPVWVEVTVSCIEPGASQSAEIVIVQDISGRKEAERARKEAEIAAGHAQLQERQEIAKYMHDGTGQLLTGIAMYARGLLGTEGIANSHKARIAEIEAMAIETLRRVRAVSRGLVPMDVRAESFSEAMHHLAENFATGFGVECQFKLPKAWRPRDDAIALHLYLIAQEAMLNAIRHGRARTLSISVRIQGERIKFQVGDDGSGFSRKRQTSGIGLLSMKQRAVQCGGQLEIRARRKGGTRVVCSLLA